MSPSTGITQHVSNIVKLNRLLILTAIIIACCSCIHSKPIDLDRLEEHQLINNYYPTILSRYHSDFVQRAAPRLGRASPRLGRAAPRLGRHAVDIMRSRLNHVGQYYNANDDATNEYPYDIDSSIEERRAAPRLGRAIKLDQHQVYA
ncbi:unnamed protein product [Rotaria sp. Silwood2]|nr:unnamed protein product [Rotaria sp. Silwood2]CAF2490694.1 unnamed protein product [Rotaria sp. Silwood2]CAF2746975.1 unnamed protein product [Rotaria sp. Silwood2]CAF2873495.1 unnamed protein product [Rotaria sp. Silwood2]CAF3871048.1 unnamed protein product [Rotaria sp. Silwood2]